MARRIRFPAIPWNLLLVFLLLAMGMGVVGFLFFEYQKAHICQEQESYLATIANSKVQQIANWRKERHRDATVLSNARSFARAIQQWRTDPTALGLKAEILDWMSSELNAYTYSVVFLFDPDGNVLLAAPDNIVSIDVPTKTLVTDAVRTRQVILSDFHRVELSSQIDLDLVVPLFVSSDKTLPPVGILVLRIDPDQFLYPLIQSWPTPSQTGETLLIERDENDVLYLNELRHRKKTALSLRLPMSNEQLPAAAAVRSYAGFVEGMDYRGVPVWAVTQSIPDSPWFLVAKVDAAEITAPIAERGRWVALLVGLLILATGASIVLFWQNQQAAFYRERYQSEKARRRLAQQVDTIMRLANDIILLADDSGRIIQINERAIAAYGYSREQLLQMNLRDLRPPEIRAQVGEQWRQIKPEGMIFETSHQRQDGTTFPVEVSARPIELDSQKFYQEMIRDISERKQADEEIRLRAQQLELLYDAGLTLNQTLEPHAQLELLCQIATKALHSDNVTFFRYDAARNDLGFEFGVGLDQELGVLREKRFPLGAERGLIGWVAQRRISHHLSDVTADPRWIVTDQVIRSALWVPVLHDEQLLGVLSASSPRLSAFTPQDERLFVLFANQVAVAMENARLFEETRRRLAELDAVNRISTALRAAQTIEEMLPRLAQETQNILDVAAVTIWLHDPEKNELCQVATSGFPNIHTCLKPGEGIAGKVFESGQTYISPDFKTDPGTDAALRNLVPPGLRGTAVPIRAADKSMGVLFASVELPRQMTVGEISLLTTLAEIAGNAIHRTRLHEQTERRLEQLQSLHTIDISITRSFDLGETLGVLLEQALAQLRVDAGSILLLNHHTGMLEYAAGRGFRTESVEHSRLRLGEENAGRAALERCIVSADFRNPNASLAHAQLIANENFLSYYRVPLIVKEQIKGVLEIFHRSPLNPDAEWLGFMEVLAGQAAIALDNATLFNDLQQSNVELTQAYDMTIEGWSRALDLRDMETEGHTQRVTQMVLKLARAMGMDEEDLGHIRRGALLHDIGKIAIPDAVLFKPSPLTDTEWEIMRKHPTYAYALLSTIPYLQFALDIPYCHHEKWDGTGYPRGLKGKQIPLAARVFAIVDVWDALRSDRPYRAAWTEEKALEYHREQAGKHFDPRVVKVFLEMVC
ncbi:Cyclic di-GMP phosphodiesterase response regulator RpfG [Anaerolineae bacterium]|nr:Cyclic di-GMP phosphodiesterase response regulator RpfG [Anaerolineae bacterium]